MGELPHRFPAPESAAADAQQLAFLACRTRSDGCLTIPTRGATDQLDGAEPGCRPVHPAAQLTPEFPVCKNELPSTNELDSESADDSGRPSMANQALNVDQLNEWSEDLIRTHSVPMPLDPYVLCDKIARHRGRAIKVRAVDLGATTAIGHLISKRRTDIILCDVAAPTSQRTAIICHEIVHLLRHGIDSGTSLMCGIGPFELVNSPTSVSADMYADWREWEAETGARILTAMTYRRPRPDRPAEIGNAERSLAAAFGLRALPGKLP
jgi:hypothetical protein